MIFEMACYRGTMVWIDGKKSEKSWGCGAEGNTLTSSDLQIGPHRIEAIEVIGPEHDDSNPDAGIFHVFGNRLVPKEIELRTADGKYRGPVTKIVTTNEAAAFKFLVAEDVEVVKLANGEDYEVDEITIYLRAILQPVN